MLIFHFFIILLIRLGGHALKEPMLLKASRLLTEVFYTGMIFVYQKLAPMIIELKHVTFNCVWT